MKRVLPVILLLLLSGLVPTIAVQGEEPEWELVERGANFIRHRKLDNASLFSWESAPQWVYNGSEYVPYIFEDKYDTDGYYEVSSGLISARIYDYYTTFYAPGNFSDVRLYEEAWEVQYWSGKKGSVCDVYDPLFFIEQDAENINITASFGTDYPNNGERAFTVKYIFREGRALKHEVDFTSHASEPYKFRVLQKWAGIVASKVQHDKEIDTITSAKVVNNSQFRFLNENGNLSIYENQWDMYYGFNETDGSIYVLENHNLKPVEIDVHAKGLKADFIFGDWTLVQGESLEIDPATATLSNPNIDGDFSWEMDSDYPQFASVGDVYLYEQHITQGGYKSPSDYDEYWKLWFIEWPIGSLPTTIEVTDSVFKYHGREYNQYADGIIYWLWGGQPSTFGSYPDDYEPIWYQCTNSSKKALVSFNPIEGINQERDLGTNCDNYIEAARSEGRNWVAIACKDAAISTASQYSSLYAEEHASTPDPTLYIEYISRPQLTTYDCDQIKDTQVRGKGAIVSLGGGGTCEERGFVYDTSSHGDPGDVSPAASAYPSRFYETGSFGVGSFNMILSSLTPYDTYYVRVYCYDGMFYAYGNEVSFIAGKIERQDTTNTDFDAGSHDDTNAEDNNLELGGGGANLYTILSAKSESGWGSGTSNSQDPYNTYYYDGRGQFVVLASELTAAGVGAGDITKMQIHVYQQPGRDLSNFRIRMRHTTATTSTSFVAGTSGWTNVYGPTTIPSTSLVAGQWYQHVFTTPFPWDGESNLLIDLTRDGTAYTSGGGMYVRTGSLTNRMCAGRYDSGYTWPFDTMPETDYSHVPSIKLYAAGGYATSGTYTSSSFDISPLDSCDDSLISWSATLNGQSLSVYSRYSTNGGSNWSGWALCTSGQPMPGVGSIGDSVADALVQYKVEMSGNGESTPQLHDITMTCICEGDEEFYRYASASISLTSATQKICTFNRGGSQSFSVSGGIDDWLAGWAKRIKITLDHDDVDATLEDFPVLIYLSSSSGQNSEDVSFVFDELGSDANRKKIALTKADGVSECYVEVEKWSDATETAWLWAKIPDVSSTVDIDLYLYYDSTHADNDVYVGDPNSTPAENVWDSSFKLVTHMRDDPDTSSIRDSTTNDNDGTKTGAGEPAVTADGKIDDAQNFDGGNDYVSAIDSASLDVPNSITIEAWFKRNGFGTYQGMVAKGGNGEYAPYTLIWHTTDQLYFLQSVNGNDWTTLILSDNSITDTNWHQVVGTNDGTTARLYIDGIERGTDTSPATTLWNNNINVTLGCETKPSNGVKGRFFDGILDEIRISDLARTPAWIKATYETGRDDLFDFGSEETQWLPGWANRVKLTTDYTDIDDTLSNFPVLVYLSTSSGRNDDDVSFVFDELQNDGNRKKIAVTASDGATQHYVEIEKWDHSGEQAWLWVNVPSVSRSGGTSIYLYYDSTHADNTDYVGDPNSAVAENVWDANFKLVTHMRDDPDTSSIRDSTTNDNDGAKKAANQPSITTTAIIDGAQDFDGVDDYALIPYDTSLNINAEVTIEAWINLGYTMQTIDLIADKMGENYCLQGSQGGDGTKIQFSLIGPTGGDNSLDTTTQFTTQGIWYYIAGTYDGITQRIYVNSVQENSVGRTGAITTNTNDFVIGGYPGYPQYSFNGIIEEVRVSSEGRSAAWIKATYETGRDDLFDFEREEAMEISGGLQAIRILSAVRTPTYGITLLSDALRQVDTSRTTVQSISLASSTSRLWQLLRATEQSLSISPNAGRSWSLARSITQGISAVFNGEREFTALRGVTQGITTTSSSERRLAATRSISQGISPVFNTFRSWDTSRTPAQGLSASLNAGRLWSTSRTVSQGMLLSSNGERTLTAIRALTQQLSPTFNGDGFLHAVRSVSQSLSPSFNVFRTWSLSRSMSQAVTCGLDAFRRWDASRTASQGLTTVFTTDRTWSLIRIVTQDASFTVNGDGFLHAVRLVSQGISTAFNGDRILVALRSASQEVTTVVNSFRTWDTSRKPSQGLTASLNANRLWVLSRAVFQDASLTFSGKRTLMAIRGLAQQLSPTFAGDGYLHAVRSVDQGLTPVFNSFRTWSMSRTASQSVTLERDALRSWITSRTISQGLTTVFQSGRSWSLIRTVTQDAYMTVNGERMLVAIRESSQIITTSYNAKKTFAAVRTAVQSLTADIESSRLWDTSRTVTQGISPIFNANRLWGLSRTLSQSMTVSSKGERLLIALRSVAQEASLSFNGKRVLTALRTSTQGVDAAFDSGRSWILSRTVEQPITSTFNANRVLSAIRSLSQGISPAFNSGRIVEFTRNLPQTISFTANSLGKLFGYLAQKASIALSFSPNAERLVTMLRGTSQGIGFTPFMGEGYLHAVRSASQVITPTFNGERIIVALRSSTQVIVSAFESNREWMLSRGVNQNITYIFNGERMLMAIRGASQSLSSAFETDRTWLLSRGVDQDVSFTSNVLTDFLEFMSRASSIDFILSTGADRLVLMLRGVTQEIGLISNTEKMLTILRSASQSIETTYNAGRNWVLMRSSVQSLTLDFYGDGVLKAVRAVVQSITIMPNAGRYTAIIRSVNLSLDLASNIAMEFTHFIWGLFSINVQTRSGESLENATVALWDINNTLIVGDYTNATGHIPTQNLTKGNYTILVIKEGYKTEVGVYTLKGHRLLTMYLHSIEETLMFNIELLIFVSLGCVCLYIGYTTKEIGNKIVANFGSLVFWIAVMYQWVVSNSNSFGLVIVFLAPFLWGFVQGMHALGEYVDEMGGKPSRYE